MNTYFLLLMYVIVNKNKHTFDIKTLKNSNSETFSSC